jgi:hypothetical protein
MKKYIKEQVLIEFKRVPGVGPSIAQDLWDLGLRSFEDIKKADPQKLYDDLCVLKQAHVDRCMLYVFRCAHYFVSTQNHDPKLLQWWKWKL